MSDDLHIMPLGDLREHVSSGACWCGPRQDEDESLVWIHHSMDRREHSIEKGVVQ